MRKIFIRTVFTIFLVISIVIELNREEFFSVLLFALLFILNIYYNLKYKDIFTIWRRLEFVNAIHVICLFCLQFKQAIDEEHFIFFYVFSMMLLHIAISTARTQYFQYAEEELGKVI